MPLLMLDLDNTLLDRDAAFRSWAASYVQGLGGSAEDLRWLVAADRDGYEARERLAELIEDRFGSSRDAVLQDLRLGMVDRMELDPVTRSALQRARTAGWSLVVVTNGSVRQQEHKLRHTGLDRLLDGWVVSDGLGIRKPDPRIFTHALAMTGDPADGSWMVGDSARHDIAGARAVGASSIWLRRGRDWPADLAPPDRVTDTAAEAVDLVVGDQLRR